jgi:hypothetical protein
MDYIIDYEKILEEYEDDEYVYIIDGCFDVYASINRPSDEPCEMCGSYDWVIEEGIVRDLKNKNKGKRYKKIKVD